MGRGRFLKAAERACNVKARFETAAAAEAFSEYRFRAYLCPVCHHYHLTSRGQPKTTEPEKPKPQEHGPKLSDLDWSAALDPSTAKPKRPPKSKPPKKESPPEPSGRAAACRSKPGKDGRVLLVIDGRLVKSARIADRTLRAALGEGMPVMVDGASPPRVLSIEW